MYTRSHETRYVSVRYRVCKFIYRLIETFLNTLKPIESRWKKLRSIEILVESYWNMMKLAEYVVPLVLYQSITFSSVQHPRGSKWTQSDQWFRNKFIRFQYIPVETLLYESFHFSNPSNFSEVFSPPCSNLSVKSSISTSYASFSSRSLRKFLGILSHEVLHYLVDSWKLGFSDPRGIRYGLFPKLKKKRVFWGFSLIWWGCGEKFCKEV